jgi:hypothetical protein
MRFEDHNQQHGSSADAGAILNLSTAKPRGLSAVWPRGGLGSGAAGGASDWGSSNGGGGAAGGSTPPLTGLKLKLWEKQQKKAARGDGLSSLLISGFLSLAGWLACLSLPPSLPPSLSLPLPLSLACAWKTGGTPRQPARCLAHRSRGSPSTRGVACFTCFCAPPDRLCACAGRWRLSCRWAVPTDSRRAVWRRRRRERRCCAGLGSAAAPPRRPAAAGYQ